MKVYIVTKYKSGKVYKVEVNNNNIWKLPLLTSLLTLNLIGLFLISL